MPKSNTGLNIIAAKAERLPFRKISINVRVLLSNCFDAL